MLLSSSHVDDTLCAGRKPHVKVMLSEYQKHLNIETLGLLKKHLGMSWEFFKDENGIIHLKGQMEKMRQSIISSFKDARGKDAKIA